MPLPADIIARIHHDFAHDSPAEIVARLDALSMAEPETFSEPRIIRCLVFAAQGTREHLESAISLARLDPRDLIAGAEYKYEEHNQHYTPLRDLRKPFIN